MIKKPLISKYNIGYGCATSGCHVNVLPGSPTWEARRAGRISPNEYHYPAHTINM